MRVDGVSALFARARKKILDADIDLLVANIKFALVDVQDVAQARPITAATNATPIQITSATHGLATNDFVSIFGVGGNTNANGHRRVTVIDANTYTLQDPVTGANIAGNGAYTSGGFGIDLMDAEFVSDIAGAAIVARSGNLASKTTTNGVFNSANPSFTAVTGDPCEILLLFLDTGSDATSPLIAVIDSFTSGMPVTPNGGDINLTLSASGILQLF